MASDPDKLTKKHSELTHSELQQVTSHVQREDDEWFLNTIMIKGHNVPFKFKRKKPYKSLSGARVNLTYYPAIEKVAGFNIEIMQVVRIKIA
ncbi:MAG: hypothetical protein ACI86X_000930 [Moritella sp.]|jgi:hypothetical protein